MPHIEFGVFDHLDRRPDTSLGQTYEDRLKLVEAYDRAGFHAYQIAEHHATPLTVAPAPMCAPAPTWTVLHSFAPVAMCTWSPIMQSCSTIAPVFTMTLSPRVAAAFTTLVGNRVGP